MTLGHGGGNALLVVGAIGGERGHGSRDLVEQVIDLGRVVHVFAGQRRRHDPADAGVHAQVQHAPRPACRRPVLLQQPLACAAELQARAVHQQVQGLAVRAWLRAWHCQRLRTPAQRGMVRHRQSEPEQADDGADQALRLAQGQMEHGPERECGQDCQRRIPGPPNPGSCAAPLASPLWLRP